MSSNDSITPIVKMTEFELDMIVYDEERCKIAFEEAKSKFVSAERYPLQRTTKVTFECNLCSQQDIKTWSSLHPTVESQGVRAVCKKCGLLNGVAIRIDQVKQKNVIKKREREEALKTITVPGGHKYCFDCEQSHPITEFINKNTKSKKIRKKCNKFTMKKASMGSVPKYTLESFTKLLESDNATLVSTDAQSNNHVTTKTIITFICGSPNCGKEHTKKVDGIERTGGYCAECSKLRSNKKKSIAGTGVKRESIRVNKAGHMKRRKYTIDDIRKMLLDQGSELVEDQALDVRISTNQKLFIICANSECNATYLRGVHDFDINSNDKRAGPFCLECAYENRSSKISIARTKVLQPITDPTTQSRCPNCRDVRLTFEDFWHTQNKNIRVVHCQYCRVNFREKNERDLEKRKNSVCDDPTKQKCESCYRWRELSEFEGEFITCKTVCRKSGRANYKRALEKLDRYNKENKTTKMCCRCWKITERSDFITDVKKIEGTCCSICRDQLFENRDQITDMYLQLKEEAGPCVDCDEADIRITEFDHVNMNTKSFNISEARSIKQLQEEITKCVVRCGICHRRRTKEQLNYGQNSRKGKIYVDDIKRTIGGCVTCKWYDENLLEALEFDHIDIDKTTKLDNISTMVANNVSIDIIDAEIQKCQLLCVHCHKLKTIEDNGYYLYLQKYLPMERSKIRNYFIENRLLPK